MACDVSPVAIFKSNDYAEDLPIFCQPENWREEWGEDSTAERRGNFHRCYRYKWHLKLLQVQVTPQIATGDNSNCNGCRHLKLLLCAQCYVQLNQSCWIKSFDLFFQTPWRPIPKELRRNYSRWVSFCQSGWRSDRNCLQCDMLLTVHITNATFSNIYKYETGKYNADSWPTNIHMNKINMNMN